MLNYFMGMGAKSGHVANSYIQCKRVETIYASQIEGVEKLNGHRDKIYAWQEFLEAGTIFLIAVGSA